MPQCQNDEYLLRIYSVDEDGIVTDRVDLTDGRSYSIGPGGALFAPPPQKVAAGANSAYRHGHDVVRVRYDNSRVDIRNLTITGTRPEILAQRIQRITTLLEKARYRQERGWGERVYVERDWRHDTYYSWDVDPAAEYFYEMATVLRKEVLRGEFVPPREDVTEFIAAGLLGNCRLNLECYPFWQGLQQNIVLEHVVDNHNCEVYAPFERNWINIPAADLPGDAPCLLRIRAENITTNSEIFQLRVGIKRQCWPTDSPCCDNLNYQTEDYESLGGDTVLRSDADFSCSTGVRVSPSNANNTSRVTWWTPGTSMPSGTYRAFLRIRNNDSARTIQAQFRLGGTLISPIQFTGPQVEVASFAAPARFVMVDLGLFTIPPRNLGTWYPYPLNYTLAVYTQSDAAAGTIDIDYLLLLPVEGGLKLEQFALTFFGSSGFLENITWEMDGFAVPPTSLLYSAATESWFGYTSDDLGFMAYVEPGFDHCIMFSNDRGLFEEAYNILDLQLRVTIDIIPQYLYIR